METDGNGTVTYRTVTREELKKMGPIVGAQKDIPGEGTYSAYFRSENKNYKSIEFRMPQEIETELAPDTAKLEDLMDQACSLFVKAWKLSDARCRRLIEDSSAATVGSRLDYEFEQSLTRVKLLEIKSKMEEIVYRQYEKGLSTGKLPEQVVEPMAKALASHKTIGIPLQEKSLDKAKADEADLARQLRGYKPEMEEEPADLITECIKAQQKAYQATHPMHNITTLRPFYDGTWTYRGKRVVATENYMYAMRHDITWTESAAGAADLKNVSDESLSQIRQDIRAEYGI
jgi:hypothetical protein